MDYSSGLVLPQEWRDSLAGEAPLPAEPLVVNFPEGPDCVLVEVRIKALSPGERLLSFTLMDDGWEADEELTNNPETIEHELGGDRYIVMVAWADDPDVLAYLGLTGSRDG
jgi:hypothetical protein